MPSDTRQFGAETYLGLKASFRDLVALCGGGARCVGLTRTTQSRLSEAMSPQHADRFRHWTISWISKLMREHQW